MRLINYRGQKYAFHSFEHKALPGLGRRVKKIYAKLKSLEGRWVRIPAAQIPELAKELENV